MLMKKYVTALISFKLFCLKLCFYTLIYLLNLYFRFSQHVILWSTL